MRVSFYISESTDPYYNLGLEHYLFNKFSENEMILILWQNDNTIVIGKNQNPYAECDVDRFVSEGGKIARRRSGGGAVYHDLGNLNYTLLFWDNKHEGFKYIHNIVNAMAKLGVPSAWNGKNDLIYNGRKYSGNAIYKNGDRICQHGTFLISSATDKVGMYLTPDKNKLERNYVHSVNSRVCRLNDDFPNISKQMICDALIDEFKASPLVADIDMSEVKTLQEIYASRQWIYNAAGMIY